MSEEHRPQQPRLAPAWQRARVENRRTLSEQLYKQRKRSPEPYEEDGDGTAIARLRHEKETCKKLKRHGGCGGWYGRVAKPRDESGSSSVHRLDNPYFEDIAEGVVRSWLTLQNQERDIVDDDALAAFVDYFASEIHVVFNDAKRRNAFLQSLPLVIGPSMQRSRLTLGAVIPGTRTAGAGSVQMLPRYSRNLPPLVFLRGVLRDVLARALVRPSSRVGKLLAGADEALRQIGVTQAMSGRGLQTFDCQKEGVLSKVCKEGVLRGWCELGEQVVQRRTLLTSNSKETPLPALYERTEWLVHMPHLFETYIKLELTKRLKPRGYTVTKPNAKYALRHFPTQRMHPDVQVRETAGGHVRAVYDAKLYRNGWRRTIGHMHQVEAYCAGIEQKQQPERVMHAGLVYGYWAKEQKARRHRNCYHINLGGEDVDEVNLRVQTTLDRVAKHFLKAVGADLGAFEYVDEEGEEEADGDESEEESEYGYDEETEDERD